MNSRDLIERILFDDEIYVVIEKLRQVSLAKYIKIFVLKPDFKGIDCFLDLNKCEASASFNLEPSLTLNKLLEIASDHYGCFEPYVLSQKQLWSRDSHFKNLYQPLRRDYLANWTKMMPEDIIKAGEAGIPLMEIGK